MEDFNKSQLRLLVSILSGRKKDLTNLDRFEYELLGFNYYNSVERGLPDEGAVRVACEQLLFDLLVGLLEG